MSFLINTFMFLSSFTFLTVLCIFAYGIIYAPNGKAVVPEKKTKMKKKKLAPVGPSASSHHLSVFRPD
jgi:hypothetical protein